MSKNRLNFSYLEHFLLSWAKISFLTPQNDDIMTWPWWNNGVIMKSKTKTLYVTLFLLSKVIIWASLKAIPCFSKLFYIIFCFIRAWERTHCVKSVQIRSYFWSVFSCIQTWNNSIFGHFSRSDRSWGCNSGSRVDDTMKLL